MGYSNKAKCNTCGGEFPRMRVVCPHCGAVQKEATAMAVILVTLTVFILLGIPALFYSTDDAPTPVDGASHTASEEVTSNPPIFDVQETAELYGIEATLIKVTETYGNQYVRPSDGNVFIVCEFEIFNNSSSDFSIDYTFSFDAYIDDYAVKSDSLLLAVEDKQLLDGTIAAGKKMRGYIAYEVCANWDNVEVRFSPSPWSGGKIIFSHTKTANN